MQFPQVDGYDFTGAVLPVMKQGSLDYLACVPLSGSRLAFVVADQAGFVNEATLSLFESRKEQLQSDLISSPGPEIALARLNESFAGVDICMTVCIIELDYERHSLLVANAGHIPPLLRQVDGTVAVLGRDLAGIPLGIMGGFKYRSFSLPISPGENVIMCTDGLIDCLNADEEFFGLSRLMQVMGNASGPIEELQREIISELQGFRIDDDVCLFCMSRQTN